MLKQRDTIADNISLSTRCLKEITGSFFSDLVLIMVFPSNSQDFCFDVRNMSKRVVHDFVSTSDP